MGFLRFLEKLLTDEQPTAESLRLPRGDAYRWLCPCGAGGRSYDPSQNLIESNADQHYLRQPVGHPLPYVVNADGDVVSSKVRHASGSVGRHWGWTE